MNLGCSLCILPLTVMLSVGLVFDIISQNPIDVAYLMLYGLVLLFQILMLYQVFVGRRSPESEL